MNINYVTIGTQDGALAKASCMGTKTLLKKS